MTLGALLLGCLRKITDVLVGDAIGHWLKDRDVQKLVEQSLVQAVDEHSNELSGHAHQLPGDSSPAKVRVDSASLQMAWTRAVAVDPSAVDVMTVARHMKDIIVIPGCDLAPGEHEAMLAKVLETAAGVFTKLLPTKHPAFEQWAAGLLSDLTTGVDLLKGDHCSLISAQRDHDARTMSALGEIATRVSGKKPSVGGGKPSEWRNPFEDVTGEEMSYEEVRNYFVGRHTQLQTVRKHFDSVLEGQRGTGKTMILKYLSFEAQVQEWLEGGHESADDFFKNSGNFIGVYCKLPHLVFDKSDLRCAFR